MRAKCGYLMRRNQSTGRIIHSLAPYPFAYSLYTSKTTTILLPFAHDSTVKSHLKTGNKHHQWLKFQTPAVCTSSSAVVLTGGIRPVSGSVDCDMRSGIIVEGGSLCNNIDECNEITEICRIFTTICGICLMGKQFLLHDQIIPTQPILYQQK